MTRVQKIFLITAILSIILCALPTAASAEDVPAVITASGNKIYCNGISIMIKMDTADGLTYIYDATGTTKQDIFDATDTTKLAINQDLSKYTLVYGGAESAAVKCTKIVMESGKIWLRPGCIRKETVL